MQTQAYIGGEFLDSEIGKKFPVTDPCTGDLIAEVADCGPKLASFAIEAAHDAFPGWSKRTAKERAQVLLKIGERLLKNSDRLAELLCRESGKPLKEAKVEITFSASFFDWFAAEGRRDYGETIPATGPGKHMLTIRKPLGVASFITPWNFPIGMLARKVAAALAAGCTCVVKPAEDTPLIALEFAKICHDAGVSGGVINIVPCSREKVAEVGEVLSTHRKVACLSFTGSTAVGKWLYAKCAPTMKRVHMELGGNAPFIVFNDADLDLAVNGLIISKFRNAGQTCVCANKILVQQGIYDKFMSQFLSAVKSLKVGKGLEDPDISAMINDQQIQRVETLLKGSVAMGAQIQCGGFRLTELGPRFFAPTVVTNVERNMPLYEEEVFGPVAAIVKFVDEEDAIEMANDTDKGLSAYVYTNDLRLSWKMVDALEFGMVGINEPLLSTCEAPFGGIKQSGFGKEGSKHGMEEYTYLKYVGFGNQDV